ncbi:MAG TPA: lysylphosphatidylglycerol synthase transmembrane domain-containing protein [Nitrososphaeraceae archaeon]
MKIPRSEVCFNKPVRFVSVLTKHPFTIITLALFLYVGLALYLDIGKVSKTTFRINYWTVPLILTPITIDILLLAFRFHRLLRVLDLNIPMRRSFLIYFIGLSFAITPISAGQILRSQIIKKEFDYAFSKTSPILFFEKWSELAAVLVILVALAIVNLMLESIFIIIVGTALVLVFFGIMRNRGLLFLFFKKTTTRFRRLRKFEASIENSQESLKKLASRRVVLLDGFIITIPAQMLQAIAVFLVFQMIGVKIDFVASTQVYFTSIVAGILSFIPGGLVVAEGGMLALLAKYYYNYELALLVSAVIFVRLFTFWYATLFGVITGLITYRGFLTAKGKLDA